MSNKDLDKNIAFLQRAVPPDDIYLFAELNYDASIYLLSKIDDVLDINVMMKKDEYFAKIVRNIVCYHTARLENRDVTLNLRSYDSD
jgi:hypothetical protein